MKRIISKNSTTDQQKLNDLLSNTIRNGECMEWIRCYNTDGYPHMLGNVKVHRLVNQLYTGKPNKGFVVRHTCDNKKCINPEHLLIGTPQDNNQDMVDRGRYYRVITRDIVASVRTLLGTGLLSHKQIAEIVNIDQRRVSDIHCKKYDENAKLIRR